MTSGTKTSNAQGLKCSEMKKWTEEIVSKKGADIKKKKIQLRGKRLPCTHVKEIKKCW